MIKKIYMEPQKVLEITPPKKLVSGLSIEDIMLGEPPIKARFTQVVRKFNRG
jgi:hypothetical protein